MREDFGNTGGFSMAAMIVKRPPHWGQCSRSIEYPFKQAGPESSRTLTLAPLQARKGSAQ